MDKKWVVGASPHIASGESTSRIMWQVVAALIPAGIWAVIQFGPQALRVIGLCVVACVVCEAVIQKFRGRPVTVCDGSAVVTGLLLAYVLPAQVVVEGKLQPMPWFVPVVGSIVAIGVAKHAFGGLGNNIWNPALVGRAFVQVSWAKYVSLSQWAVPRYSGEGLVDSTTAATVKGMVDGTTAATALYAKTASYSTADLFLGRIPGSMGEISALLLLVGGIYLIARRYVDWRLPACFFVAVAALSVVLPVKEGAAWMHTVNSPLDHLFAGGVMIGALFMASDMVTSPLTGRGQAIFGLGCGILTVLIRFYTGYPEGVCYAILLMNTARPLIDRHTRPSVFGAKTRAQSSA
ncbi:MAG: RnfABCDGE type electron transport complex subunit D [Bradyrhizobium sp.]|nr:RnfABCDGE type electron transport complex subunit D [Bradyrhizobium sp.]